MQLPAVDHQVDHGADDNMLSAIESELCALQRLFDQIKYHLKVISHAYNILTRYLEGNGGVCLAPKYVEL